MKTALVLPLFLFIFACSKSEVESADIRVENYLTTEQAIYDFKELLIRDVGRLPKKANHQNKKSSKFDEHYLELVNKHDLMFYYPSKANDTIYFAINRIAPSLYDKKVAIGGKVILDKDQNITFLEETFRTFKMPIDELNIKTKELFLEMINGKNLKVYEYKNSKPDEYIEFPDEFTIYNTNNRKWVSSRELYYQN